MLSQEEFVERFRTAAEGQPFSQFDLAEALKKGREMLGAYYDTYKDSWQLTALAELNIAVSFALPYTDLPAVPLRGILDRVEFLSEEEVVVYDYKSGRPKTRGEIEGTTKNSNGNYKRQLVFYRLLLSLFERGKWRAREGVIDFIEPDKKGRFHRERFELRAEDVDLLKQELTLAAREIYDLSFWDTRCSSRDCSYCALRDLTV